MAGDIRARGREATRGIPGRAAGVWHWGTHTSPGGLQRGTPMLSDIKGSSGRRRRLGRVCHVNHRVTDRPRGAGRSCTDGSGQGDQLLWKQVMADGLITLIAFIVGLDLSTLLSWVTDWHTSWTARMTWAVGAAIVAKVYPSLVSWTFEISGPDSGE